MSPFIALINRDIKLAWSGGGAATMVLSFFLVAVSLFPFGIGSDPEILARISVGIIWVTALLACLLSLDRIFQADFEDGSLDDIATSPLSLEMASLAKIIAHWCATIVPLIILAPLLAAMLNLPGEGYKMLMISLLVGTPTLSMIGAIGASLTVAIRRGGVLLSLLVLPLYVPTLIFGVGATYATIEGRDAGPALALLAAVTLVSCLVGPIASAAAIRLSLE